MDLTDMMKWGAFVRSAMVATAVACIYQPAMAQEITLDDLFSSDEPTTQTATSSSQSSDGLRLTDLTDDVAASIFIAMDRNLALEKPEPVLADSERLLAWYPKDSDGYSRSLWFRARAFEQQKDWNRLVEVGRLYLASFPKGEQVGWFLLRIARDWVRNNDIPASSRAWQALLETSLVLTPEEIQEGAELLLRAGEPLIVRRILTRLETTTPRSAFILLESLLLLDDEKVAIPEGNNTAAFKVREGMLQEIRRRPTAARDAYEAAMKAPGLANLAAAERTLLDERLATLRSGRTSLMPVEK